MAKKSPKNWPYLEHGPQKKVHQVAKLKGCRAIAALKLELGKQRLSNSYLKTGLAAGKHSNGNKKAWESRG